MNILCYGVTYLFEQFISYQYFNNKFAQKTNKHIILLVYLLSFSFQFAISFFNSPYANLIVFFISNLLASMVIFDMKFHQGVFNVFLLSAIMISTELFAMYLFSII